MRVIMRRTAFLLSAFFFAAGCSDYLSPSFNGTVYALARIGPTPVPVFIGDNGGYPLLLADTIRLVQDRPRVGDSVLGHVAVLRLENNQTTRSESDHYYTLENGQLSYDECPIGSFCLDLIAAPRVFQVVGDSLFEIVPEILNRPQYVYGRVRF